MVRSEQETGIEGFSVEGDILKRNGQQIAQFPTPICELARLEDRLFVVLHPYPEKENPEYAGTNLWALDLNGCIVWKARDLNLVASRFGPKSYDGLKLFEHEGPKILIGTTDDYVNPIIDIRNGEEIGGLGNKWRIEEIEKSLIGNSIRYKLIVPGSPPKKDQHDHLQP